MDVLGPAAGLALDDHTHRDESVDGVDLASSSVCDHGHNSCARHDLHDGVA
jgi:hypothetical protein